MRTRVLLALTALLMAIIGTAAIGSNMGFKISIPLTAGTTKFVSIPYNNSYTNADSLRSDINASIGGTCTVYNYNGSIWQRWAGGGLGQVNFTIEPGKGYRVLPAASGTWVVVGSHDPNLAISFQAGVTNFVSVPYHTTATNADTLRNEINTATGTTVTLYFYNGTIWQRWAGGGLGQVNFTIVPGNAIRVLPAGTGTWTPSHF
ncbi:MAG: hypothetical protein ACP5VN_01075 [Acidobacteriota bacterium]